MCGKTYPKLNFFNSLPFNFLGLGEENSSFDDSKFVVVSCPFDSTASYRPGSRFGPNAIIDASRNIEFYDCENDSEPFKKGIHTLPEMVPVRGSPEKTVNGLSGIIKEVASAGKIPVLLGGEHTVSVASGIAFPKDVLFISFDAHTDLREEYEDTKYSHACAMRRIYELGHSIIWIGARSMDKSEHEFIEQNNLPVFYAKNIEELYKKLPALVKGRKIYISIDIDCLDPSEAPGTGTPEPGGLSYRQLLSFLETICKEKVVGFDVVEVAPIPGNNVTEFLAAKLVYKIMSYL